MEDVVPALLEQIKREFAEAYETDQEITGIWERIDGEKAAAADIDAYATRTGDLLAEVLHRNISSDTLPDGRMYYNIANRVLSPVLEKNYDLVADVATLVQKQLNERAGIGIRPMRPEINRDRISGLVDLASDAERYDDVSGQVESGVLNYTQSVATDAVHENAEFHYKSGLAPRIVRTAEVGCCQWCQDLAGTYDYSDVRNSGNDVYRRHRNCRCMVEYDPSNGAKRQNVHTKQYSWKEDNEPLIEQRRQYGEETKEYPMKRKEQSFWTGEAKNISEMELIELQKYAEERGIELDPGFKSFDGDISLVNDFIDKMNENLGDKEYMRHGKIRLSVNYSLPTDVYAETHGSNIIINGYAYRDREQLEKDYDRKVGEHWFTQGSTYLDIAVHESAHVIVYMNQLRTNGIIEKIFGLDKPTASEKIESNISEYASKNGNELIAEAYVAYKNGSENEYVLKTLDYCGILK